jgi:hypothetical protein
MHDLPDDAYYKGVGAAIDGALPSDNPYPITQSLLREAWARGLQAGREEIMEMDFDATESIKPQYKGML